MTDQESIIALDKEIEFEQQLNSKLTAERDELRAKLEQVTEKLHYTETVLACERSDNSRFNEVCDKLEQSEKQNAAMRAVLLSLTENNNIFYKESADIDNYAEEDIYRALSTDAGKDYIHRSTVKPLVEALEDANRADWAQREFESLDPLSPSRLGAKNHADRTASIANMSRKEALATYNATIK